MSTKQYSLTLKILLLFITLVLSACQPVFVGPTGEAIIDGSSLTLRSETAYGRFNGIDFVKYEGLFTSPVAENPYSAPFEIVAPVTPTQGNGRLLIEPYHFILGAGARDGMLTPEFLFGRGFSYAAICWQPPLPDLAESHPCADFAASSGMELQIISDFGKALSQDQATSMIGDVTYFYAIGVSNSSDPLHRLLLDPLGQSLFDLSILLTPVGRCL